MVESVSTRIVNAPDTPIARHIKIKAAANLTPLHGLSSLSRVLGNGIKGDAGNRV